MDCMKDLIKDARKTEKQEAVTRAIKALATVQGDTGFITKMDGRLKTIELQTLRAENPLLKLRIVELEKRNSELEAMGKTSDTTKTDAKATKELEQEKKKTEVLAKRCRVLQSKLDAAKDAMKPLTAILSLSESQDPTPTAASVLASSAGKVAGQKRMTEAKPRKTGTKKAKKSPDEIKEERRIRNKARKEAAKEKEEGCKNQDTASENEDGEGGFGSNYTTPDGSEAGN
jgi:hypothetical protein